jgi:hypothetical protein
VLSEYIVDCAEVPWRNGETEGIIFRGQVLLSGDDGGPEAFRFRFEPCPAVYAHMHLVSQFQLLLGGTMDLPKESMKLRPIAVHYTDHSKPYGPFAVGGDHEVLVLHPRKGGLVTMADRTARKQIHLGGRECTGMDKDVEWLPVPGHEGSRCKVLISQAAGPEVVIFELPPHTPAALPPPLYGRYEVVLQGSVIAGGRPLGPPGLRYVQGDEPPAPLTTGPDGGTVMSLSFDADALQGGLTGDGLSLAAAEAMERAI